MFPFITFVLDFKFKSRLNNFGIRELAKANTIYCVHVFIDEDPFKNSYQKKERKKISLLLLIVTHSQNIEAKRKRKRKKILVIKLEVDLYHN